MHYETTSHGVRRTLYFYDYLAATAFIKKNMLRATLSRFFQRCQHGGGLRAIADICVVPLGVGASVGEEVSLVCRILKKYPGLETKTHAYGTNVEGNLEDILAAVSTAHEYLCRAGYSSFEHNAMIKCKPWTTSSNQYVEEMAPFKSRVIYHKFIDGCPDDNSIFLLLTLWQLCIRQPLHI